MVFLIDLAIRNSMVPPKLKWYKHNAKVLKEYNWTSAKQLFNFLNKIQEKTFSEFAFQSKEGFIENLYKALEECERSGEQLADIRETMADVLLKYYSNDYSYLLQCYKKERKKLRRILSIIDVTFRKK